MLEDSIESSARTVLSVSAHFELLKGEALQLQARLGVARRGYFTPSEEEATRHLLVSYWQSRCALMELLDALRRRHRLTADIRPDVFIVALAAAAVLVDAARFLGEAFRDRPLAQAKLNEPDLAFGIPPCVYDSVQQSLTDPAHAWSLYRATQYFDTQRGRLESFAEQAPLLRDVWRLLDRTIERVRVPVLGYAAARWGARQRQVRAGARQALGRTLFHLQRAVSLAMSGVSMQPGHRPALPLEVAEAVAGIARPGDVFITRKEHALTNYFLPGYWPHAALYLGDAASLQASGAAQDPHFQSRWPRLLAVDPVRPQRVLEALKDGVWLRSVASPLGSDAVAVLRPHLSTADVARALTRGIVHEGKPYDFDFDFTRSERLVCTEVVYRSYEGIGGLQFPLTRRAGRLTLSAEDLIGMALRGEGFEPLAVYARDWRPELATGGAAREALRATCRSISTV